MDILKLLFGTPQYVSRTDTSADDPDPDPSDLWAFTDPDAREQYARSGKLSALERDIRFEVMRAENWLPVEMEYKEEIRRLLREGAIRDKGAYWFSSPFPTVYFAVRDGEINVGGRQITFRAGDEVVFQCRMSRQMNPDPDLPVLVARLRPTDRAVLCGQMGGAMKEMGH